MKRILAIAGCAVAVVVLSACGSTKAAVSVHSDRPAPGLLTFVRTAPSNGLGAENSDLFSATARGMIRDLTSTPGAESDPVWSADGKHVVFTLQGTAGNRNGGVSEVAGVYVWSPGNGSPRRIAPCFEDLCPEDGFAWSPDGHRLAFIVGDSVEVMNADGSGAHAICGSKQCGPGVAELQWSPDGKQLLFSHILAPDLSSDAAPSAIWVADADGSYVRHLTRGSFVSLDYAPAWSPDGSLIAFTTKLDNTGYDAAPTWVKVMRADGSHVRKIYSCLSRACEGDAVAPVWAPDGRTIAYTPAVNSPYEIRLATPAGKTSTIRTCAGSHCVPAYDLVWSPNGRQLGFLGDGGGTRGVWVIGRDGTGMREVASHAVPGWLAWVARSSLGGRPVPRPARPAPPPRLSGTIAFDAYGVNGMDELELLQLGGAKPLVSLASSLQSTTPAWSPGGSQLAYTAGNWNIKVADRDGTHVRVLVHTLEPTEPAWAPDGRHVAFNFGGFKLGIVPASGGPIRLLTTYADEPSWSPDGREIVFHRSTIATQGALWTIHADGSGLRRLTKLPGDQSSPAWSPDGKEIAFVWGDGNSNNVYLIHPDGTHLRRVTTAALPSGAPTWSPDGHYLLVLSNTETRSSIDLVDVRSERVWRLRTVQGMADNPSWSRR